MNFREHIIWNLLLWTNSLWALFYFKVPFSWKLFLIYTFAYFFSTLMSPDLDTNTKTYRKMGGLAILWYPFKKIIHHGTITHRPVIGSLLILAYMTFLLLLFTIVLKFYAGVSIPLLSSIGLISKYYVEIAVFLTGFILADIWHIIGDKITKN